MRILQSSWMVSLVGCLTYMGTTVLLLKPAHFDGIQLSTEEKAYMSPNDAPSWRFENPEFNQWIEEIKQERETLAERSRQLDELEQRLNADRQEILMVTQVVHDLQAEFDKHVIRIKEQEEENLKHQVKILSAMAPESVVTVLADMTDDDAVRILFSMKIDQASGILEAMSQQGPDAARRASELTQKLLRTLPPPQEKTRRR